MITYVVTADGTNYIQPNLNNNFIAQEIKKDDKNCSLTNVMQYLIDRTNTIFFSKKINKSFE